MKSILNLSDRREIMSRIEQLTSNSERKWGQMNVNQALCHLTDPIRDSMGEREVKRAVPFFLTPIVKRAMLSEKPWKEGVRTLKEYNQINGTSTKPSDFEHDKSSLINAINKFIIWEKELKPHAAAGKLSREEWGMLNWKHLDHHLRQFGV